MRLGFAVPLFAGFMCGGYLLYDFQYGEAGATQAARVEEPEAQPAPQVSVTEAVKGSLEETFSTYGNLAALKSVDIASQISGQIAEISVKEGARVKKGDVILTLDAAAANADYDAAKAQLDAAQSDFQRATTLAQHGTSTAVALEQAKVKLAIAQTQLAMKKVQKQHYTVNAPFDGQLTEIKNSEGALLSAGNAITQLMDQSQLRVEFQLPERLWPKLKIGQKLTVWADGHQQLQVSGQVTYVAPNADPKSRSLRVTGLIDNQDYRLASGLFVRVRLDMGAKNNVVFIPEDAIVERLDGSFVFVVEKGKSFERQVDLGIRQDGKIEVLSGIKLGEQVVTRGQKMIRDNMAVTVADSANKG